MLSKAEASQWSPIRGLRAEPDAWPVGTWNAYKSKYLTPEGRIIDDGNKSISHSEGQGYGMLLAVLADDQPAFSSIWLWTRKELQIRPDGLTSWKWEPDKTPRVTDSNNASDGDILIAWALAEAAQRWNKQEYSREAARIAYAVDKVNGSRSAIGRVHLPGAVGFAGDHQPDSPVVNLSYWIFPAYESLRKVAPAVDWDGYKASGMTLARSARFGTHALPSDWISIQNGKIAPAAGFPPLFSYNAIRVPLYLAWFSGSNKELLRPYITYWNHFGSSIPEINVSKSEIAEPFYDKGYQAIFALAACAYDTTKIPDSLRSVSFDKYYSSTLHMLALAAARLGYSKCL